MISNFQRQRSGTNRLGDSQFRRVNWPLISFVSFPTIPPCTSFCAYWRINPGKLPFLENEENKEILHFNKLSWGIIYAYRFMTCLYEKRAFFTQRRKKMFTETETKPDICPLTLELCERCCERKILGHLEVCSFTLEPCYFNSTGELHCANFRYFAKLVAPRLPDITRNL